MEIREFVKDSLKGFYERMPAVPSVEDVTWSDLVNLRNKKKLIPGNQYRITDYVASTVQENTKSAGHQFDIIVTALSTDVLSEEAKAIQHKGDTYFADCNLNAWKIWYSLDNDTSRFAWAKDLVSPVSNRRIILIDENSGPPNIYVRYPSLDGENGKAWCLDGETRSAGGNIYNYINNGDEDISTSDVLYFSDYPHEGDYDATGTYTIDETSWGTGVIYRMIDEWNNDCPYDFKNIQFKRKISLSNGYPELDLTSGTDTWVFTFAATSYHITNEEWSDLKDGSLESPYEHESDENSSTFHDNTMGKYIKLWNDDEDYTKCGIQYLNDNVFFGYWQEIGSDDPENAPYYYAHCTYGCTFGVDCYSNTFGDNCYFNTFGDNCSRNTFGRNCSSNTFENNFSTNTLRNNCVCNTFGNNCYSNTFGNYCSYNTFGNSCTSTTFGVVCAHNTFGNYCNVNTLGDNCAHNTFGNYCTYSTFGNYCSYNTFGNSCNSNTLWMNCESNTFGDKCLQIIFNKNYIRNVIVENGNRCITLTSTQSPAVSTPLRNITIAQGVNNSDTVKTISHNTLGDTFKTIYQSSNSQVINV